MPHATIRTSYDLGPEGRILIVSLEADPAAGAEVSITVPGRAVWKVIAMKVNLVTSATVAARRLRMEAADGNGNVFSRVASASQQNASTTNRYTIMSSMGTSLLGFTEHIMPSPDPLILLPGYNYATVTASIQAGDNFSAPVLYVQETPQRGIAAGSDALLSALRRLIDREV